MLEEQKPETQLVVIYESVEIYERLWSILRLERRDHSASMQCR